MTNSIRNEERLHKVAKMFNEGKSTKEIATACGFNRESGILTYWKQKAFKLGLLNKSVAVVSTKSYDQQVSKGRKPKVLSVLGSPVVNGNQDHGKNVGYAAGYIVGWIDQFAKKNGVEAKAFFQEVSHVIIDQEMKGE
jgi:hypothetical protein